MTAEIIFLDANPGQEEEDTRIWIPDKQFPYLVLHKPSGIWYVRKKKKGKKPLFKSTGQDAKGRARTLADQMIAKWLKGDTVQFGSDEKLFRDYAPDALAAFEKSTKLRDRTKENAKYYINALIEEIGYARLKDINEGFVENWIEEFRGKRRVSQVDSDGKTIRARETFADYVKYISKVLKHAAKNGVISRLPEFENPDPKKPTGRIYSKAEIQALLNTIENPKWAVAFSKKKRVVLRLMAELQFRLSFNCIMRLREMLLLSWDRVDIKEGVIKLRPEDVKTGSKTGKGREIYVDPELVLPLLRKLHALRNEESPWVFPSRFDPSKPMWDNKHGWAEWKKRAGITGKARWHDLRHTALTWALVGDEEFQAQIEKLPKEEQDKLRAEKLKNPVLVAAYAGTSIRTIESVYLKVKAAHTRDVSTCIRL